MPSPATPSPTWRLISAPREDACLAYVNTLYWRGSPVNTETLHGWAELLAWCQANLGLEEAQLRTMADWGDAQGAAARHLVELSIAMREVLYRIFSALAGGQAVAEPDLAAFNQALAEAPPRTQLGQQVGGFAWRVPALEPAMPALLAPVLWSAADLMTRAASARIRQCANPKCLWMFVDASKAGTRRWCDMNACGNRAKAQRHYHRSKRG
jgi:predicted RNA-binding Zn ribbon-like protein